MGSDVMADLNVSLSQIQDGLAEWEDLDLNSVLDVADKDVESLSTMRDEYMARRKVLTSHVREFVEIIQSDKINSKACSEMVEKFKSEYDFLANLSKVSERSFADMYAKLRAISDPLPLFKQCVIVTERARVAIQEQEQLQRQQQQVPSSPLPSLKATREEVMTQMRSEEFKEVVEREIKEGIAAQVAVVRAQCQREAREKIESFRESYEREHLAHVAQDNVELAKKDEEIRQLLASVEAGRGADAEAENKSGALDIERGKRRRAEESLRAKILELSEMSARERLSQEASLAARQELRAAKTHATTTEADFMRKLNKAESERKSLVAKLSDAEAAMRSRPPLDLKGVLYACGVMMDSTTTTTPTDGNKITVEEWSDAESLLVGHYRRLSSDAAHQRVQLLEKTSALALAEKESARLKAELAEKKRTLQQVEQELAAQDKVASRGGATLSSSTAGKHGSLMHVLESAASSAPSSTSGSGSSTTGSGGDPSILSTGNTLDTHAGRSDQQHVVLMSIKDQRDRFMRLSDERGRETEALRALYDRALEERDCARTENLELYRRLRLARMQGQYQGDGSVRSSSGDMQVRRKQMHHKEKDEGGGALLSGERGGPIGEGPDDDLEARYLSIYEEQLDPFRLEEVDRKLAYARLNFLEAALVSIAHFMLSSAYTRYALLAYVFVVHIFAASTVLEILDPALLMDLEHSFELDNAPPVIH